MYGGYSYGTCGCQNTTNNGYALILVLFILLVIIGSAWANKAQ